jgi:hypothetical protein
VASVVNNSDIGVTREAAIKAVLPVTVQEMMMIPWPMNTITSAIKRRAVKLLDKDPAAAAALAAVHLQVRSPAWRERVQHQRAQRLRQRTADAADDLLRRLSPARDDDDSDDSNGAP